MYSKLPETLETVHAKEASELQSQVQEAEIEFKLWNSGVFTATSMAEYYGKQLQGSRSRPFAY